MKYQIQIHFVYFTFKFIWFLFVYCSKENDAELGATAGLASVETLDDAAGEKGDGITDDGMETVRLDGGDGTDDQDLPKNRPFAVWLSHVRRNRFVTGKLNRIFCLFHYYFVFVILYTAQQKKQFFFLVASYVSADFYMFWKVGSDFFLNLCLFISLKNQ